MSQFNYTSGNPANLTSGATANMTDVKGPLDDVKTFLNSRTFNEDNLPVSLLQKLGLSDSSGQKGRGKSIIAQTESRTNTAYGLMTTPDQVTGLVLPTDGLLTILYQATWNESVDNTAFAAIFLGSSQLKVAQGNVAAPPIQEAPCSGGAGIDVPLSTGPAGLMGVQAAAATAYTGDVTTGQLVGNAGLQAANGPGGTGAGNAPMGGACYVFAAAGTYTVSVQFRASSGSVTVKNRKLWVKAEGY